jgi:hypothetical protein
MPRRETTTRRNLLRALAGLSLSVVQLAHADGLVWYRVTEPAPPIQAPPTAPKPEPHTVATAALQSQPQAPIPASFGSEADRYAPLIAEVAEQYNIDPMLMHAVIHVESAYNEHALSDKGAVGLMQLMPATAERFGKTALYQPRDNLEAGAAYLQSLLQRFDGQLNLALASYNAGEGAVERNGNAVPPYPETRAYVQHVLADYARLKGGNVPAELPTSAPPASPTVVASAVVASARKVTPSHSSWDDLGKLGQLLISSGSPSGQTYASDTSDFH